jgi:hypothetical protein
LFLKWLFNELTRDEITFLFDVEEFHRNQYMQACFRIANVFGKKELRRRLKGVSKIFSLPFECTHRRYIGLKSLRIRITYEEYPVPEHPPFTGWRRHQRIEKGNPESSVPFWETIPFGDDFVEDESFSWFEILSVMEIPLFQGKFHLMIPKEEETEIT